MNQSSVPKERGSENVFAKLAWEAQGLAFLVRNLWYSRRLFEIPTTKHDDGVLLKGMGAEEIAAVDKLQRKLRNGKGWNVWRQQLYRLRGRRLVIVAIDSEQSIIGCQIFYFRKGECKQGIIHSSFTGVKNHHQGCGIGTRIRTKVLANFSAAGLAGATSFILEENKPSMKSAQRVGYQRVGQPGDGKRSLMLIRFDKRLPPGRRQSNSRDSSE